MLSAMAEKQDPSGIEVYPKLPVPSQRRSEPRLSGGSPSGWRTTALAVAAVLGLGAGAGAMWVLAPTRTKELTAAKKDLAAAQTAAKTEADRADAMTKQVEVLTKDKNELQTKYSAASMKLAENEKAAADANAAAQKRLQQAVDSSSGEVSSEGEEIHLKLVDKVLFAVGDDQLTDKGKAVLAKVGKALTDLKDKQVWVQGHTDDQPIIVPPPKKPVKLKRGQKPPPPDPDAAGPRFASNWELSAARALQVVHYLQDVAKIEPSRLAALAFGQYRPVSKSNKALNRRIEIVLYPQKAVIERPKK
jgi:chemotaxis protein MotB